MKRLIHDECTGSWFGFPNPRYMCRKEWLGEMGVALFKWGVAVLVAGVAALCASYAWPGFLLPALWMLLLAFAIDIVSLALLP